MKWLKRVAFGLLLLVVLAGLSGLSYEQWSRARADHDFPAPGRLVEVDGRNLHLNCTGQGSPTVILEAGLDFSGSMDWVLIQPEVARFTRVCSYDRAGIMWSDPSGGARDAHRISAELHALLEAAGEAPPYVLAGHSLGGLITRMYDAQYRGEVAGFVFVDAAHPEQMSRLSADAAALMTPPSMPPVLASLLTRLGVFRLMKVATGDFLPERARPPVVAQGPRSLIGANGEILALEASASDVARTGLLGSRPVVVLTATDHDPPPGFEVSDAVQNEIDTLWSELQHELAALSTDSVHRLVVSGHYIQLEAPGDVTAAVQDVVTAVREARPLSRENPAAAAAAPTRG